MESRRFWVSITIVAIFLSAFGSVLLGAEDANQGSGLQTLQAKIDTLEKTIRTQQEQITRTEKALSDVKKQLDEQIKENKRLRLLCEKAGIDTTKESGSASKPIGRIIYRGKERDEDWFNRMYKRFSDKIVLFDGKFVALSFRFILSTHMKETPLPVGTITWTPPECKVLSVIGDDGVLLVGDTSDSIFHVTGYDGPLLSDGKIFPFSILICVGTYEYTAINGAKKTVQSFKMWEPEPLTREQFAEAISSGVELVNYVVERGGKIIEKPIR